MKLLLIRLSAIGDVIQGIPCLVGLKETFPDWEISWLVEETSAPLLTGHPCLKHLFVLERKWRKQKGAWKGAWKGFSNHRNILKAIRSEKFDIAIDLQGLLKSGLWTWLSGAKRRIGHYKTRECAHWFLNEYAGDRPVFDPDFPLIERYLEPAKYLGADLKKAHYVLPTTTKGDLRSADQLLHSASGKPILALCPWSAWDSKNWPLDHWIELGKKLLPRYQLILIGSESDGPVARNLEKQWPGCINLVGRTSLSQLAEIFRRCVGVVGPDSGPVHLANATSVPKIVMIFGSTSWKRSGPFGKDHRALSLGLDCQPCFERRCPLGHLHCLKKLEVDQVYQEIVSTVN